MDSLSSFKNLKFKSVNNSDIEDALSLLKVLGYSEHESGFSVFDAVEHGGFCAWDDGLVTEGWLRDESFKSVTLDGLKEMVGETNRCDNTLSNNFTVAWEQVFGEKFVDSVSKAVKQNKAIVSKAVKQNKDNTMKNDTFTLERLLGCEVKVNYSGVTGYVTDIIDNGLCLHICCGNSFDVVGKYYLTFFTEDGDELTFDEYVKLYYPYG